MKLSPRLVATARAAVVSSVSLLPALAWADVMPGPSCKCSVVMQTAPMMQLGGLGVVVVLVGLVLARRARA